MESETADIKVNLTREELELILGFLSARRIYIPYGEKWGYSFWQPYMDKMLHKIESALEAIE
ncbi:MAG: hypothetical protein ACO4AV_17410 [bacterium]